MLIKRVVFLVGFVAAGAVSAQITDFNTWTEVQDPAHPLFTSTQSAAQLVLSAGNGAVPAATDIGYQSVNGATFATSTSGYGFSPANSFRVAVDYSMSFASGPTGALAIGFGVGEDSNGMNSAGVVLVTSNGAGQAVGGGARINDVNQSAPVLGFFPSLSGSLHVAYNAATGTVTVGSGAVGANLPSLSADYVGIQQNWAGSTLITSMFLRSGAPFFSAWSAGTSDTIFSNFRVLEGSAIAAVPEPAGAGWVLAAAGLLLVAGRRRR